MPRTKSTEGEGETSVIAIAQTKSQSLRTTIPMGVVRQLGLKQGVLLNWKIDKTKDGEFVVIVKPVGWKK